MRPAANHLSENDGMKKSNRGKRGKPRRLKSTAMVHAQCELIPIDRLEPDRDLSRGSVDERAIKQLAKSLRRRGQRTPMIVRRIVGNDRFKIICGERRWLAAKSTTTVRTLSCWVIDEPDDGEILFHYLVENLSRDNLPPLVLAERLDRLMKTMNWSVPRLAAELGVVESRVRRPLALLTLTIEVQEMVRRGELPPSHAYEISKAPEDDQLMIAQDVVIDRMRLDETIDMVNDYRIDAGDLPRFKRRPWRFLLEEDREVLLLLHPEDAQPMMRKVLLEVLLLIENFSMS
jgi:ParB family chromosome partitioning protein